MDQRKGGYDQSAADSRADVGSLATAVEQLKSLLKKADGKEPPVEKISSTETKPTYTEVEGDEYRLYSDKDRERYIRVYRDDNSRKITVELWGGKHSDFYTTIGATDEEEILKLITSNLNPKAAW